MSTETLPGDAPAADLIQEIDSRIGLHPYVEIVAAAGLGRLDQPGADLPGFGLSAKSQAER